MTVDNTIGIGIDIELISRFDKFGDDKNNQFLRKVFTRNELAYCFSKKVFSQHLAVRFTAKEAIAKAISSLGEKTLPLNKIEIVRNVNGVPSVNLKGYNVKISLSHCEDRAIAFVIVEKN